MSRCAYTRGEIEQLEHMTGLVFAGYMAVDRGELIPVLLRRDRTLAERHDKIMRLNPDIPNVKEIDAVPVEHN